MNAIKMIKNKILLDWVEEVKDICEPDELIIWDGSQKIYDDTVKSEISLGKAIQLNPELRPNSILYRSHPSDVARIEKRTFISTSKKEMAGPTNNWISPDVLKPIMLDLFKGAMKGRTMYVIPFSMGPIGLDMSRLGVEITDSAYVALNMHLMTRTGSDVVELINQGQTFTKCWHSVGYPLDNFMEDPAWPCAPMEKKYISHFPEENTVWSYGSGYGGNALLGKKCLALRIASALAKEQGWLAEHMLILKLTNPENKTKYITGAFPSACGKTNLAMINPSLKGWKAETVGDDIAWLHLKDDGQLYAINPEAGFFGVASGTSKKTNPHAIETVSRDTIFTNVALTDEGDVWWKDLTNEAPDHLIDWLGQDWYKGMDTRPDHPNGRFTSALTNCPTLAKNYEEPVPISAILFGGRRPTTIPLIHQSFSFNHGIFMGSIMGSEITAATIDENIGHVRRDPFAMLPFIGYNISDYINHWASFTNKTTESKLPKIFYVNWFRKDGLGYIWPGFGDNIRVLSWIWDRIDQKENYVKTAIGLLPNLEDFNTEGIDLDPDRLQELFDVDHDVWIKESNSIKNYYQDLYENNLPTVLENELNQLLERLQ